MSKKTIFAITLSILLNLFLGVAWIGNGWTITNLREDRGQLEGDLNTKKKQLKDKNIALAIYRDANDRQLEQMVKLIEAQQEVYRLQEDFWKKVGDEYDKISRAKTTSRGLHRSEQSSAGHQRPDSMAYIGTFESTAYCPCGECGTGTGKTATGAKARRGVVAVDPRVIELGTKLQIEGYGEAIAADTGGAIKGEIIDVCFNSHQKALQWGRRTVKVWIR